MPDLVMPWCARVGETLSEVDACLILGKELPLPEGRTGVVTGASVIDDGRMILGEVTFR